VRRITADSNIYISALNFGGKPLQILELARAGEIELAISNGIITETSRVLHRKFDWKPEDITDAFDQILRYDRSSRGFGRRKRFGTTVFFGNHRTSEPSGGRRQQ